MHRNLLVTVSILVRCPGSPPKNYAGIGLQLRLRGKRLPKLVQQIREPLGIRARNTVQSESSGLHWDQADFYELASIGIHFNQVHHREIATEFLVSTDTLIVRDEVAATVQDQTFSINFDGFDVVGGVTVDEINTTFNEPVREIDLLGGNLIAPVAAPMD